MADVLAGKVALVTGAYSGLGRAVTELLHRRGAKVFGIARDKEKALGQEAGPTGFAYTGVVPATTRPAAPSPKNTASSSPLDQLKSTLTTKADAGDSGAEEALADLYRFADTTAKPDDAAAMYWYKRASARGVARIVRARNDVPRTHRHAGQ